MVAFYYLDKPEKVNVFVKQFSNYFHKDLSTQTVMYELAKIRNIDPSNNTQTDVGDSDYKVLWDKYISEDKISDLKIAYKSFKKGNLIEGYSNDFKQNLPETMLKNFFDMPKDVPKTTEEIKEVINRDSKVVENALALAGYVCELDCGVELFIAKDGIHTYTEGHHLIPLSFQKKFAKSLDVEANVISLCPACHRKLHYGINPEKALEKLYLKRIDRLKKCGIVLSFEQLLLMYS